MKTHWVLLAPVLALGAWQLVAATDGGTRGQRDASAEYRKTIQRTANMVSDSEAISLAGRHGLSVLNLTWEDTGRFKGSSVGPNISDMTIQVGTENSQTRQFEVTLMPVIRYPNFSDLTCDVNPDEFTLLVGNEKGRALKRVSLTELLERPTRFMTKPGSWTAKIKSLLAERDKNVLVSAQACFLPVPKEGKATFNPVLFNYQSRKGDPAVLTILATREGTSMTIIDNARDAFNNGWNWGQRLFHNANGQRASLTGERLSDYIAGGRQDEPKGVKVADAALNMVLLVQVPLKQKRSFQDNMALGAPAGGGFGGGGVMEKAKRGDSDVENAVIGHGDLEGPFTEFDNLPVERDPRYPVRVTVQFYKATSNGVVSAKDIAEIKRQIADVYSGAVAVGSLVTDGETGRITEYDGPKVQPPDWWERFWHHYEEDTGYTREVAREKLRKLLGRDFRLRPVTDLYVRDMLRTKGGLKTANSSRTASGNSTTTLPDWQ